MIIPQIHDIDKITFPNPEEIRLKNNMPLFGFNGTQNDIIRLDLIFNSGRWTEPARLVAESTQSYLKAVLLPYHRFS